MKAVITELTVDIPGEFGRLFRVDYPGNVSNKRRSLVICKTKKAAKEVVRALSKKGVLWPVESHAGLPALSKHRYARQRALSWNVPG